MIGPVEVANMALRHIGYSPIVSFNDQSPEGLNSKLAWEIAFKEFLGDYDWSFATDWATLIPVTSEVLPWGYTYCHYLPSGFERLVEIKDFTENSKYSITLIRDVKVLASDSQDISIKYIRNDFSIQNMHGMALMALMIKLALHLDLMLNAGSGAKSLIPLSEEYRAAARRHEITTHNSYIIDTGYLNRVRNQD